MSGWEIRFHNGWVVHVVDVRLARDAELMAINYVKPEYVGHPEDLILTSKWIDKVPDASGIVLKDAKNIGTLTAS